MNTMDWLDTTNWTRITVIEPPVEECVISYPEMVAYAVRECFLTEEEVAALIADVELAELEADQDVRNAASTSGQKLTETAISALVRLHSQVVDAKARLRAARAKARRAAALHELVLARGQTLEWLVRLQTDIRVNPGSPLRAPPGMGTTGLMVAKTRRGEVTGR